MSIYSADFSAHRDRIHTAILNNQLPDSIGSWETLGANGLNIRLLTVRGAEALHRRTGMTVHQAYLVIETAALLVCCLLLYAFLEPYTGWPFAFASLLYWGSVLPLTYLFHRFHPWDKPSVALWLLALICTRKRWWWALAVVLLVGVVTKYDIVVFPLLVFLAYRRAEPLKVNILRTAALLASTLSAYLVLRTLTPNGFEARPVPAQVLTNLQNIRLWHVFYPPLLALGLPALLAAIGYSTADRFAKGCVQLTFIVALILFLQTNFVEFRAEVPLLMLLLPSAWYGLVRVTTPQVRQRS